MVTVPPHVSVVGEAVMFFILVEGYVSVKAAPVMAVAFGLVSVMVISVLLFIGMELGLKDLATVGGAIAVKVAEAATMGPALVVDISPVLFIYIPAPVAVTGTTMEQ